MSKNIALIDMDGTLCDYDSAMRRELAKLRSPGEPVFEHGDELPNWAEARRTAVSCIPGFWRNLERLEVGFQILEALLYFDFEVHVLSKGPSTKSLAWSEKHEWCKENLPSSVKVTLTEDKSLSYGRILVDDWPSYYRSWLRSRPRGLVIVPAQVWNVDAESHAPGQVWRYDGKSPATLGDVLKAVQERKSGEPLILPGSTW